MGVRCRVRAAAPDAGRRRWGISTTSTVLQYHRHALQLGPLRELQYCGGGQSQGGRPGALTEHYCCVMQGVVRQVLVPAAVPVNSALLTLGLMDPQLTP